MLTVSDTAYAISLVHAQEGKLSESDRLFEDPYAQIFAFFYHFWDADHRLTKAYVLLADDKLTGQKMRHFTFEELTQSFGFARTRPPIRTASSTRRASTGATHRR